MSQVLHRSSLGRPFGWLWAAYAVSTLGTFVAFDAFALIAILVLDAGPAAVSALAAAGLAVGAVAAVPLGPWVERRRKRRVMVGMDLVRLGAMASVPVAYGFGVLSFAQLVAVAVIVGAADIAFCAASGACLRGLLAPRDLLTANARLEGTLWTATAIGPPAGGAAIGLFGPVVTVAANAVSFGLSALGLRAMGTDPEEPATTAPRLGRADLLTGWRTIRADPLLRALQRNVVLVNALILAPAPLMALLMLRDLGFSPLAYAVAFGVPCLDGIVGARLSRRLVARHGSFAVLRGAGTLRACWSLGLAAVVAGPAGLAIVLLVQLGLVTSIGIFNPVFATLRLQAIPPDRTARVLAAWSVTNNAVVAALTVGWGVLAGVIGVRPAIGLAGLLMLLTPLLLPRRP